MKLSARDAAAFRARPVPRAGILIYGPDTMRVALAREDLVAALTGAGAAEEMRLTRIHASALRGDPAAAADAAKARGFFDGPRVVLIEDAGDPAVAALSTALEDWQDEDATVVVTAGQLSPRSKLRTLFEKAPGAVALPVYPDPPGRAEVEAAVARAGLTEISAEAMADLTALGQAVDPGEFRQTLDKLALYAHGRDGVTPEDVAAVAPIAAEAELDDLVDCVADGDVAAVAARLPRLGRGTAPTALCIALNRHFRRLHAAAAAGGGVEQALGSMRPPVFGPRRDRMARQARAWGAPRLEQVLKQIFDTDLALRSGGAQPAEAMVERLLIRIAIAHPR